jgi:hypothetical protein
MFIGVNRKVPPGNCLIKTQNGKRVYSMVRHQSMLRKHLPQQAVNGFYKRKILRIKYSLLSSDECRQIRIELHQRTRYFLDAIRNRLKATSWFEYAIFTEQNVVASDLEEITQLAVPGELGPANGYNHGPHNQELLTACSPDPIHKRM